MAPVIPVAQEDVYVRAMQTLQRAGVPFLLGGAMAVHHYTGIWRNTKDLDLFLLPEDRNRALVSLAEVGYQVEIRSHHWLAKALEDDIVIDLITGFGDWLAPVDESWFQTSRPMRIFGLPARVVSATDLIWMKAYVAGRERFDGADIVHVIFRAPDTIDWRCLLERFGDHWELLCVYVHLYRFVYPDAAQHVPDWLVEELLRRTTASLRSPSPAPPAFRGPLLDRYSFLVDVREWGQPDLRESLAYQRGLPVENVITERAADERVYEEKKW